MRVKLTTQARTDLRDITLYIALDNIDRALSFSDEIETACLVLGSFPERYPEVWSIGVGAVRLRPFHAYNIYYLAHDDVVSVLRIVNGAQDQDKLFP